MVYTGSPGVMMYLGHVSLAHPEQLAAIAGNAKEPTTRIAKIHISLARISVSFSRAVIDIGGYPYVSTGRRDGTDARQRKAYAIENMIPPTTAISVNANSIANAAGGRP